MMQNGPSLRVLQRKRLNAPCAHMHCDIASKIRRRCAGGETGTALKETRTTGLRYVQYGLQNVQYGLHYVQHAGTNRAERLDWPELCASPLATPKELRPGSLVVDIDS